MGHIGFPDLETRAALQGSVLPLCMDTHRSQNFLYLCRRGLGRYPRIGGGLMSQGSNNTVKLLRLPAGMEMTGISQTSVYRLVREDKFPQPVHVAVPKMTVWPSDKI